MSDTIERNGIWIRKSELDAMKRHFTRHENNWYYLTSTPGALSLHEKRAKLNEDNRKWAWVTVGKTRIMCWVDNKTGKAYKSDGYSLTWMEIKNFKFERWCTSFDL